VSAWLAGTFEVEITPPLDVPLGSGFNPPQVEGVADPLFSRALVLSDGTEQVALTSNDILAIDPMLSGAVRRLVAAQTGMPPAHVLVSATHTHSCGGRLQPSRGNGDEALLEILARQIAGAVAAASRSLRPATLTIGSVPVKGITQNRRDPDAPVDDALRVLRVDGPAGLMAVMTTFACHPALVARDCRLISADFPGMMAGMLKAALGPSVVVLPTNGACGDVNPVVLSSAGLESARWIAQRLAGEAIALLARLEAADRRLRTDNTRWGLTLEVGIEGGVRVTPPIRTRTALLRIPYKQFASAKDLTAAAAESARRLTDAGVDAATVKRWQEGGPVPAETEDALPAEARETRRRLTSELLQRRSEAWSARVAEHQGIVGARYREVEVQAFALGARAALLAVPFELFSQVGLEIQAASVFPHLMLLSYSNDLGGYLMPDEEYGRGGFEPGITFYGSGAADAVRSGCIAVLRDLAATVARA
jgi:neutral ceramidase